jgi:hypothetical protein
MHFNTHLQLEGRHSFLSASKHSWVNYDDEKLDRVYLAQMAAARGTQFHKLAHDLIRLGQKLPTRPVTTMGLYVNDAINYRMIPEQALYYSDNAFGTADAIIFRRNKLRIHDLKMGVIEVGPVQLEIYAAYFCLEYKFKPFDIEMELRIYQNNEVRIYDADPDVIFHHMDKIITFDKRIKEIQRELFA